MTHKLKPSILSVHLSQQATAASTRLGQMIVSANEDKLLKALTESNAATIALIDELHRMYQQKIADLESRIDTFH